MTKPVAPLVVNGWTIFAHPQFLDQLEALTAEVERLKAKDATTYKQKNATKRLAAIWRLAFDVIPQDPERDEYRQGDTLGDDKKHWLRAKFFQQYRLFFRYRRTEKLIIYAWVNDDATLRAYGSKSDAYAVFKKMLDKKRPPNDWDALKKEATAGQARLSVAATGSEAEKTG